VYEIGWCGVENNDLSSSSQGTFERALKRETELIELTRWCLPQKEPNVDVAGGRVRAPCDAAEEIGGYEAIVC